MDATKNERLEKLIRLAKERTMTRAEIAEQRRSFIRGGMRLDAPTPTDEDLDRMDREQGHATPAELRLLDALTPAQRAGLVAGTHVVVDAALLAAGREWVAARNHSLHIFDAEVWRRLSAAEWGLQDAIRALDPPEG